MYLELKKEGEIVRSRLLKGTSLFSTDQMVQAAKGSEDGLEFDFNHSPLFHLPLKAIKALGAMQIGNELQEMFSEYGISLGEGEIEEIVPQEEWTIHDMSEDKEYHLVKEDGRLEVWHYLQGTLYYGFIHLKDGLYPYPVFYKRTANIADGKAQVNISKLDGRYDMIGWEKSGKGVLGYRILNKKGTIIYDGKISFRGTGPFTVGSSIVEGPFVQLLTSKSATISFSTNFFANAVVRADDRTFFGDKGTEHEILVDGLQPDTKYRYSVHVGDYSEEYSFQTAPASGSRKPFSFAYASDSRSGQGGGERNVWGVNTYVMKKIMAVAAKRKVAFFQFTGDMIDGYCPTMEETLFQYSNWKRTIEPFAHYFPVYPAMGNHEALVHIFSDGSEYGVSVDKFPYATDSAEVAFARAFVIPKNGPESEDGAVYDPNPNKKDFPSYEENVYYYTYDNVAMVVLNSNYWYSPSLQYTNDPSGNLHAYIMDNQMEWLGQTLKKLEDDDKIDFIFVSQHTPAFPNGGHSKDDMWYGGKNKYRAIVGGKPVEKGIIERRDEYLSTLMKSSKVVAMLTGDEHNYNRMHLTKKANIYPEGWDKPKITEAPYFRELWQVNNGAAGAPYYAQEVLPWSSHTQGFTTQHAIVLFHVEGKKISMEVINPDTLGPIEKVVLRK